MLTCFLAGNGSIAIKASEAVIQAGYVLSGVFSFDGSLKKWAQQSNVKHFDNLEALTQALSPNTYDYLFSINNPWIIPDGVLSHARCGTINYHDSPLPRYSGLHATSWALINGETEHGISFHEVSAQIDAGEIYKQTRLAIADEDNAVSLNTRILDIAIQSFKELLQDIKQGNVKASQQDNTQRSYFSNADRPQAACLLSVENPAEEIRNLVRGLTFGHTKNPLGLAKLALPHQLISVGNVTVIPDSPTTTGDIVDVNDQVLTIAGKGATLGFSDLKTLSGKPVSLKELTAWGAIKGAKLREFTSAQKESISSYNQKICSHESKWIPKLATAQPFIHPYCANVDSGAQTNHRRLAISDQQTTLSSMQWLAVFTAYCMKLSQQPSVDLGLAVPGIPTAGEEFFANTVPFCIKLNGSNDSNTFSELTHVLETELTTCQRWKSIAIDALGRYPELSHVEQYPQFSTTVALLESTDELDLDTIDVDLLFIAFKDGSAPSLIVSSNISEWHSQALTSQLATIANTVVNNAEATIDSLSLLNESERHQLLNEWCYQQQPYPQTASVNDIISAQAQKTPHEIAVSDETQQLTYKELEQRANQLAHALLKQGAGPGKLIGLCLERCPDLITSLLGIIKTGAAYVPIDPSYPIGRIQHIVTDSGIQTVITQTSLQTALTGDTSTPLPMTPFYLDQWVASEFPTTPVNQATHESLLYVIYTSGSTGKPKGVEIKHQSLINHSIAIAQNYQMGTGDKMLQSASISFDVAGEQIFPSLFTGAQIVIPSFNPLESFTRFEQLAKDSGITAMILPTAFWHQWVIQLEAADKSVPPTLRSLSIGTEKALGHRLDSWQRLSKGKVAFFQGYGPTETTITATMYQHQPGKMFGSNGEIPIGQPLPNVEVYVVDKTNELVPLGVTGELLIGGAGLAAGYHGQPDLTAEKFISNPFKKNTLEKVYKTGDWVRRGKDGDIYFVGREDQQIKIRGFRVEIGEIESALQSLQLFEHNLVLPIKDSHGVQHLIAYTVAKDPTAKIHFDTVSERLQNLIPEYMLPAKFIALKQLPMTPNNKVDRHQLLAMADLDSNTEQYQTPATETEKIVAQLWENHLECKKISRKDSFFALGGDSLRLLSVLDAIEQTYGVSVPFSQMYKHPTLEDFCAQLPDSVITPLSRTDSDSATTGSTNSNAINFSAQPSPIPNARIGRDLKGAPKWYIQAPEKNGHFIEILGYGFDNDGQQKNENGNLKINFDWLDIKSISPPYHSTPVQFKVDKHLENDQIIHVDFDPFRAGEVKDVQPMSLQQKEVWLAASSGSEASKAFNLAITVNLNGKLDTQALRAAIQTLYERHESLRTTFYGPQMLACVTRDFCIDIPCFNLTELSGDEKNRQLNTFNESALNTEFDLTFGPLLNTVLLQLTEEHYALLITVHHIVADGWSLNILTRELSDLYSFHSGAKALTLENAIQYRQYNADQQRYLHSNRFKGVEQYWLNQFKEPCPALELPLAKSRPSLRTFAIEHTERPISADLIEQINTLCSQNGYTFFSYLYAAYLAFIHRLTGQDDIVIGVPFAGQALMSGGTSLIGHCVNVLPIRTRIAASTTFLELVKHVQDNVSSAFDHSQFSYVDVLERIDIDRDISRAPLVAATFNVYQQNENLQFANLSSHWEIVPRHFSNFELVLDIFSSGDNTQIHCDFNTDLFNTELIQHWLSCYETLISHSLADPNCNVGQIQLISDAYKKQLSQCNATSLDIPKKTLYQWISEQAITTPERLAVSFEETQYNYAELDKRSNQLANFLIEKGILPGTLIGLCVERSAEMLIALLGILKTGAGYVPLDPEYPRERIEYILNNAKAPLLLTETRKLDTVPEHNGETLCLDTLSLVIDHQPEQCPTPAMTQDDVAYVIYTSGSTGNPKGVQVTHANVVNFLRAMQQRPGITLEDKILAVTTLSFDIAVLELYLPLVTGAAVDIVSRDTAMNASRLAQRISDANITMLQATPATWRLLLESGWKNTSPLKALVGGEALPQDLIRGLLANTTQLWNMYGPTETTVWSTCYQIKDENAPVLIGSPIANTQIHVLDAHAVPVIPGSYGELYIGGLGVSNGYLHLPDMNNERFIENPFSAQGGKLYRTGDQVRQTLTGDLEYISRLDNQIKIRGYRIELGEIETALASYPSIQQCVVIVREESAGDARLIAYYVTENNEPETTDNIRQHIQHSLPSYMVPQFFVKLDKIPTTPNGKIDRKQLPEPGSSETQREIVEPRNDFERAILAIWEKQLGAEKLGITDDFFESGGHSILAMKTIMEMSTATGVDFEYSMIFSYPTIQQLVGSLGKGAERQACNVVSLQPSGEKPPVFCVCGIEIYRSLAMALGQDQPVLGVYAHEELALVEKALSGQSYDVSVENLANAYIEGIQKQYGKGPYQLIGISFGGFLAIQIAKKLQQKGHSIESVVLLDTILPTAYDRNLIQHLAHKVKNLPLVKKLRGKNQVNNVAPNNEVEAALLRERCFIEAFNDKDVTTERYNGNVILVKAEETAHQSSVKMKNDYGWNEHLVQTPHIITVPGDHLGMIKGNNAKITAEKLKPFMVTELESNDVNINPIKQNSL